MKHDNTKKYTVTIKSLSHDGRGIAEINGKTSSISVVITGESVECVIMQHHSRYNEGKVIAVLKPSPQRVTPECQHFMVCGGCSMQHLPMEEQLRLKEQMLFEQLEHFGQVIPENKLAALTGNPWHYR